MYLLDNFKILSKLIMKMMENEYSEISNIVVVMMALLISMRITMEIICYYA